MFSEPHSCVDAGHELGKVLGEAFLNEGAETVVFLAAEIPKTCPVLFPMADETGGVA
jgi:hypothetical protein